jgi:DnaD/phage-associated family protein
MSQVPAKRPGLNGEGDLAFSMALCRRGFVAFPRLLLQYAAEAFLEYETSGMLLHLMHLLEAEVDSLAAEYRVQARGNEHFHTIKSLVSALDAREMVRVEESGETVIVFSLRPLFARLRAAWLADLQQRESQETKTLTPAEKMTRNQELLRLVEQRFGRPLAEREVDTVAHWIADLGFDHGVVGLMIEEAAERGRLRFDYLNGIARDWHEQGVRTLADAEAVRAKRSEVLARNDRIVKALRLGRRLTAAEEALLKKWTSDWGFSEAVLLKACDQTVNIKDPNFRYIDAVLEGWRKLGVQTAADAERVLAEHKQKRPGSRAASLRASEGAPQRSNVFLPVEKKDKELYEQLFGKPRKR